MLLLLLLLLLLLMLVQCVCHVVWVLPHRPVLLVGDSSLDGGAANGCCCDADDSSCGDGQFHGWDGRYLKDVLHGAVIFVVVFLATTFS